MRTVGLLCLAAGIATNAKAGVIVYHNDNPELDQLPYRAWSIPYFPVPRVDAMIDLTRDAFAQPATSDFSTHAVGFTAIESPTSSSDSLG
ncbi:MAG: hypothetical protein AAGA55_02365 [Planctomycetota bacterium]